jgi:hypothetical protein
MSSYELRPIHDSRKSFYGKANVQVEPDTGKKSLISYTTKVAEIENGMAYVFGTYNATTLRHIKEFLTQNGFEASTAKQIMKDFGVRR